MCCSCPPFECSCTNILPKSSYSFEAAAAAAALGWSPLAGNTPHTDTYSPPHPYSSLPPPSVDATSYTTTTSSSWSPAVDWPQQSAVSYNKSEESLSWPGWCSQQQGPVQSFPPNASPPSEASQSCDQQQSLLVPYHSHHHQQFQQQDTQAAHAVAQQTCLPSEAEHENLFTFDSFQPGDIFAFDGLCTLNTDVGNDNSQFDLISNNQMLQSVTNSNYESSITAATNFCPESNATNEVMATRFLQCLDDIIGDCLEDESCQNNIPVLSANNSAQSSSKIDIPISDKFVPITSPPSKTLLTTMTTTTKITSSIQERIVINPSYVPYVPEELPMTYHDQSPIFQAPVHQNIGFQSQHIYQQQNVPSTKMDSHSGDISLDLPHHDAASYSTPSHYNYSYSYNDNRSPKSVLSSPPTFQNLDTLETTRGSPISYADVKSQPCPNGINAYYASSQPSDHSVYPLENSPNYCNNEFSPYTYSLPERGSVNYNGDGTSSYDVTLYASSVCLSSQTDSESQRESVSGIMNRGGNSSFSGHVDSTELQRNVVEYTCPK